MNKLLFFNFTFSNIAPQIWAVIIFALVFVGIIVLYFLSLNPLLAWLKYVATSMLIVSLVFSAVLSSFEIYQYKIAKSENYGILTENTITSNNQLNVTYTGSDYGFNFESIAFNTDYGDQPYMLITYDHLDIDLTKNYNIFVNEKILSNQNKNIDFIEADYLVSFFKDETDVNSGVMGDLHIKYIFNEKQTFVYFYANYNDYNYWANYLSTDSFVVNIKESTVDLNTIPTNSTLDLSNNYYFSTGTSMSPIFTFYANRHSDYLKADYLGLINVINRNGGFSAKNLRVFVSTDQNPDLNTDTFIQLKDVTSDNSDFYTANCKITLSAGVHSLTFLTVELVGNINGTSGSWYYVSQYWTITSNGLITVAGNQNYNFIINNQLNITNNAITDQNIWG